MALAACLVFLSENGLLASEAFDADGWERLTLDVAASRLDRIETAGRLRTLHSVTSRRVIGGRGIRNG